MLFRSERVGRPREQRRALGAGRGVGAPRCAERDPGDVLRRSDRPHHVRIGRVGHDREVGELGAHDPPPLGDAADLAEAVELVAGEVAEHEQLGLQRVDDLRHPPLVDLEDRGVGRAIAPDEVVLVDLWPVDVESACLADLTRTFVVGDVADELREWHALCREALDLAAMPVCVSGHGGSGCCPRRSRLMRPR